MTSAAQRLFARLTSPSFDILAGVAPPAPTPCVHESDATDQSIPPATSSSSRRSFLDLPTELLERIVEMAWPNMSGHATVIAPCRRLQPVYDRLSYRSISADVLQLPYWSDKIRWAPALLNYVREFSVKTHYSLDRRGHETACPSERYYFALLCRRMRQLEILDISSAFDEGLDAILYDEVADSAFLPNLKELGLLYNPFKAAEPLRSQYLEALDQYDDLERLVLRPNMPRVKAGVHESTVHEATTSPPVAISALELPRRLTSITLMLKSDDTSASGVPAWVFELFGNMSNLTELNLTRVPSVTILLRLLSTLLGPSHLRLLDISFALSEDEDPSFTVSHPSYGERAVCAPFLRLLPGLQTLVIDNTSSLLNRASLQILRERPPLHRIHFNELDDAPADPPIDFLHALQVLGPHVPHEVVVEDPCEHERWSTTVDNVRFGPVFAGEEFPSMNDAFNNGWDDPPEDWSERMDGWRKLIEYCEVTQLRLTGTVRDSVKFAQEWYQETLNYSKLRADHGLRRGLWGEGGPLSVTPEEDVYEELHQLLRNRRQTHLV
ncbi:hypothetical protein JCM10049v2_000739 [Rhodotorula toruloides]